MTQKCMSCKNIDFGWAMYPCNNCVHNNVEDHYEKGHECGGCKYAKWDDHHILGCKQGKIVRKGGCEKWTERKFL